MHRRCYLMILFNITALSNIWVAFNSFFSHIIGTLEEINARARSGGIRVERCSGNGGAFSA